MRDDMTPKKEAEELIAKFQYEIKEYPSEIYPDDIENQIAKKCAIICIDEILKEIINTYHPTRLPRKDKDYWKEVKKEVKKS